MATASKLHIGDWVSYPEIGECVVVDETTHPNQVVLGWCYIPWVDGVPQIETLQWDYSICEIDLCNFLGTKDEVSEAVLKDYKEWDWS